LTTIEESITAIPSSYGARAAGEERQGNLRPSAVCSPKKRGLPQTHGKTNRSVTFRRLFPDAFACSGAAVILRNPIDADFIKRADNAGWDETMLLPHQGELSLVINASVLATLSPS
jgi:hypothetical protein